MKVFRRVFFIVVVTAILAVAISDRPVEARQAAMTKATMLQLMNDLLNAGFFPQVELKDGAYFVTVSTDVGTAATAGQVNTFATNRGVTAKVLAVRFE